MTDENLDNIIQRARPELCLTPVVLGEREAAEFVALSKHTLRAFRVKGGGPRFIKIGRRVVYKRRDLQEWIESMETYENTSEVPYAAI